ncbi:putative Surfeit 6 protein [Naja naja]|nr:putative Surfeit 6 protein [Naja naja]
MDRLASLPSHVGAKLVAGVLICAWGFPFCVSFAISILSPPRTPPPQPGFHLSGKTDDGPKGDVKPTSFQRCFVSGENRV